VAHGYNKETRKDSAIKLVPLVAPPRIIQEAKNEVNKLKMLKHKAILPLIDSTVTRKFIVIVTEFSSYGDVLQLVLAQPKRRLSEEHARHVFAQMASVVHFLHIMGYAHRDLKCDNFFINSQGKVILGDFGHW